MKEIIDPRSAYERFTTRGGLFVSRDAEEIDGRSAIENLIAELDRRAEIVEWYRATTPR